ncbi:MAG: hypothetical protein ACH346_07245 [Chthoniobacterales bacterium]
MLSSKHYLFSIFFLATLSASSALAATKSGSSLFTASPKLLLPTDPSSADTLPVNSPATAPLPDPAASNASLLPMLLSNDSFAPLSVTLKPTLLIAPLPSWALSQPKINREDASVEIALPALSEQSQIENYTLTVTFQDTGDGGPLVEWVKANGDRTMVCSGLGVNGPALGLNSGTILIPYDLAFDGGSVVVSHASRFDKLISVTVRPGHTANVAALGGKNNPAIIDEADHVISKNLATGGSAPINEGDFAHANIISAELSARMRKLPNSVEFIVPLHGLPEATIIHTDFIGLDLESHLEVQVNGISFGTLSTPTFQLDAPEFVNTSEANGSTTPQFQLAGWRNGSLYIPAYVWQEGDNTLLFVIKKGQHSSASSSSLFLRNTSLDLRYSKSADGR